MSNQPVMQTDSTDENSALTFNDWEPEKIKRVVEAALLTAQEPLSVSLLKRLFENQIGAKQITQCLNEINEEWLNKGVELKQVADGWRFQAKVEMQSFLNRLNPPRVPRYSRAVLETLAIITYHQPVTRGDIEEIRGISVSSSILKALIARGWIDQVGHRNVPGRPALFATTHQYLSDLGLCSLDELPPLEELGTLVEHDVDISPIHDDESSTEPINEKTK